MTDLRYLFFLVVLLLMLTGCEDVGDDTVIVESSFEKTTPTFNSSNSQEPLVDWSTQVAETPTPQPALHYGTPANSGWHRSNPTPLEGEMLGGDQDLLPLPPHHELEWVEIDVEAGILKKLPYFPTTILRLHTSPDERWLLVETLRTPLEAGSADTALIMIDSLSNSHWTVSEIGDNQLNRFSWTDEGRLLFIDAGELFLADADGNKRAAFNAPVHAEELWMGAGYIALVHGENQLFRVNIETARWEKVENTPLISNLSLSWDKTTAAIVHNKKGSNEIEYWFLSLSQGSPAQFVLSGEHFGGHGGRMKAPPLIPNTHYWLPSYLQTNLVIDQETGAPVAMEEVAPFIAPLANHTFLESSPDGLWAFSLVSNDPETYYVASMDQLDDGRLIEGSILGWQDDPSVLYVYSSSTSSIQAIPLLNGDAFTIVTNYSFPYDGESIILDNYLLVSHRKDFMSYELELISKYGEEIMALAMPTGFQILLRLSPSRIGIVATELGEDRTEQNDSTDTIYLWAFGEIKSQMGN